MYLIKGKNHFIREIDASQGGSDHCSENISGSLDLARADPTAVTKSQYRIGSGQWGGGLNLHMRDAISDSEIASAIHISGEAFIWAIAKRYGR